MHLQPMIAVVTNVDADHLGTHGGDFEQAQGELRRVPAQPAVLRPGGDLHRRRGRARPVAAASRGPYLTYGFDAEARRARGNVERSGVQSTFDVVRRGRDQPLRVTLNLPGRHNVLNALAAIAVATELEIDDAAIQRALAGFQGIDRRLQLLGDVEHGARQRHARRRLRPPPDRDRRHARGRAPGLARAPHRARVPAAPLHAHARPARRFRAGAVRADVLLVAEVYAAGEAPIAGADAQGAVPRDPHARPRRARAAARRSTSCRRALAGLVRDGDVVLTMGAGSIGAAAHDLPRALPRALSSEGAEDMTQPACASQSARVRPRRRAAGRHSSEREVSLNSGSNVLEALQRRGVDAHGRRRHTRRWSRR